MSEYLLEVQDARKNYSGVAALDGLSLSIEETGIIFAFLGPNGAGKTTFIKSLLGLIQLDSGTIHLQGHANTSDLAREQVVYLPEKFSFYPNYKVVDVLKFYARMYFRPREAWDGEIKRVLALVGLGDLAKRKVKTLSKGQLQRLGVAGCLMSDRNLIILDEPFSGLDPIGVKELKEIFLKLKTAGKTLIISSHILAEVEKVCDQLAIIHHGKCLIAGKIAEIKKREEDLEDYFYRMIKGAKA